MRLVVYLSGERGKTIGWHRTHDSVAASSHFQGPHATRLRELLEGYTLDKDDNEVPIPDRVTPKDYPLYIGPDALADLASDIKGNDEVDTRIAELIEYVCTCEAICDDVYLVMGKA